MRAIFVMFDTLIRDYLGCYGQEGAVDTPNFDRLAARSAQFNNHFAGSLPCMPARRDLHTGRLNFLHRSWGPLEPFDTSFTSSLKEIGVYSHLITDHYHYFELGGLGYTAAYNSYEFVRGQEADLWKGDVAPPLTEWQQKYHPDQFSEKVGSLPYHYMVNRQHITQTSEFPSTKCFDLAQEFIDANAKADNWFLQIETFDPHEPFYAPPGARRKFPTNYDGPIRDWPPYDRLRQEDDEAEELRANYRALLSHCDAQLGRILDQMESLEMWKDTVLIVSTDHGFLMGEHGWWAKNRMPAYREIAHIPLFISHPEFPHMQGEKIDALTQTPDLMPTILQAFGAAQPPSVTARSLIHLLESPAESHYEAVLFGYFGGAVNVTDGRYFYFRYPDDLCNQELYQYTLLPTHMLDYFSKEELAGAELIQGGDYFSGYPVLRLPVIAQSPWYRSHGPAVIEQYPTQLFDLSSDPNQTSPLQDREIEALMADHLSRLLKYHDAPPEVSARLGLGQKRGL